MPETSDPTARDQLANVGRRLKRVRAEEKRLRTEARPLIEAALRDGVVQAEIVELTGYTRENVRLIARDAGIQASATWSRKAVGK